MTDKSQLQSQYGFADVWESLRSRVERRVGIKEGVVTLPRVPRNTPPPPSPATRSKPPSGPPKKSQQSTTQQT